VEDQDGADVVFAFPIPLVQLPAAQSVAYLLNRPGGFLEQALHAEGLSTEATAAGLGARGGGAALFVAVDADGDAVADATAQLRALMQRIAGGAITARQYAELEKHVSSLRPWARWEQLFLEEPRPTLVSLDELRRFAHSYLTEEKLVIVSAKRTE
jgi:hypothetical protein